MARKLCLVLLLLNLAFIWGNSMLDGEQSRAISDRVIAVLVEVFHIDYTGSGGDEPNMNFLVRKAAHATEFAALGVLGMAVLSAGKKRLEEWVHRAILFGVLVALTDETIQLFHARTSSVKDVWLDSAGLLAGILLAALVRQRQTDRRNRKHQP